MNNGIAFFGENCHTSIQNVELEKNLKCNFKRNTKVETRKMDDLLLLLLLCSNEKNKKNFYNFPFPQRDEPKRLYMFRLGLMQELHLLLNVMKQL